MSFIDFHFLDMIYIIVDSKQGSEWITRTALVDSRNSVKDIEFAPKHMGLKLVCLYALVTKDFLSYGVCGCNDLICPHHHTNR